MSEKGGLITSFVLVLGDSQLTISGYGQMDSEVFEIKLPLGIQALCDKFFKHANPTDLELEYAITEIEDHVMPLDRQLAEKSEGLRGILNIKTESIEDIPRNTPLSLDQFERVFNDAHKRGKKHEIAALLIIRECLHHLRFSEAVFI
jgi:hypothetical protein